MAVTSEDPKVQKMLDRLQAIHKLRQKIDKSTLESEDKTIRNPLFLMDSVVEICWSCKKELIHNNLKYQVVTRLNESKIISLLDEIYDSNLIDRVSRDTKLTTLLHSKILSTHNKLIQYNEDYTDRIKGILLMFEEELLIKVKRFRPKKTLKQYLPNIEIVYISKTPPIEQSKKRESSRVKSILSRIRHLSITRVLGVSILISILFGYILFPSNTSLFNGTQVTYTMYKKIIKNNESYLIEDKNEFNSQIAFISGFVCLGLLLVASRKNLNSNTE